MHPPCLVSAKDSIDPYFQMTDHGYILIKSTREIVTNACFFMSISLREWLCSYMTGPYATHLMALHKNS